MKRIIAVLSVLAGLINVCNGHNTATLQIRSDVETFVEVRGTIDGAFQSSYVIDKFNITPKISITYDVTLPDYGLTQINFNGARCYVWALPDDNIKIDYSDGVVSFEGSNAAGHTYYNDNWNGTMKFIGPLRNMLLETSDYSEIEKKFAVEFVEPTIQTIDSLLQSGSVSKAYADVIRRDIIDYQYGSLLNTLLQLHHNKELTDEQKNQINAVINDLYGRFADYDDVTSLRFRLGNYYLSDKYLNLYKQLCDEDKKEIFGKDIFAASGPSVYWLLAPEQVQIAKFLSEIIAYEQYGSMGFDPIDAPGILKYMETIAPESESVRIIKKMQEDKKRETVSDGSINYIDTPLNTLAEISKLPEAAGKYCLVDIWATWCVPCINQFQHMDDIHKLISKYDDLEQVYISIDEDSAAKQMKELVEKYDLTGLHILATKSLKRDIKAKVFENNPVLIPRYVLLSPYGEVICADMPRPEVPVKLEQALDKYLSVK